MVLKGEFTKVEKLMEISNPNSFIICINSIYRPRDFDPTAKTGFYIKSSENTRIEKGEVEVIYTGLKVKVSISGLLLITPRKGISLSSTLRMAESPVIVGTGYLYEIGIPFEEMGHYGYVEKGETIAHAVPMISSIKFNRNSEIHSVLFYIIGSWDRDKLDETDKKVMEKWFYWINLEKEIFSTVWEKWHKLFSTPL